MVEISLVRIDDRLIHGQVIMAWCKVIPVSRIVAISDKAARDPIRKMLLETVAPPGINVSVFGVTEAIEALKAEKFPGDKLLLLFTNPTDVLALVESGIAINRVNIGGMSFTQGKKRIAKAVAVDEQDICAFKRLRAFGLALEMQMVPGEEKLDLTAWI